MANRSWQPGEDGAVVEMHDLLPLHFAHLAELKKGNGERNGGFASNSNFSPMWDS
jgi:hypothetical protein